MTEAEANTIIAMVESNWSFDLRDEGRALWLNTLLEFDPEVVTNAVTRLAKTSPRRPTLSDIVLVTKEYVRSHPPERAIDPKDDPSRYGGPPPEWVSVYAWARWGRDPAVTAFFPQEEPHLIREQRDPDHGQYERIMTDAEYTALRDEWIAAGSPKGDVLKAMGMKASV